MRLVIWLAVALALFLFGAYRITAAQTPVPLPNGPAFVTEAATDWTAVAALIASILAGIEAVFSSISRLVSLFRKKPDADTKPPE